MAEKKCDVLILGAGVSGAADLFCLSNYTNVGSIVLIEKYPKAAQVNSHSDSNSQTLHYGDIETNISPEKALKLKEAAGMIVNFIIKKGAGGPVMPLFYRGHKMVLGVGEEEIRQLEKRYETIKDIFPYLRKITRKEIGDMEPRVIEGRNPSQKIVALYNPHGYAVNYQKLAESFIENSLNTNEDINLLFGTKVQSIKRKNNRGFSVITDTGENFFAKKIIVSAGAHSLLFAQSLGYRRDLGILPVAGSFYVAEDVLKPKIYTVQNPKRPFAAIHGDPSVNNLHQTRFGPTAKILPLLERHNYDSFWDFVNTGTLSIRGLSSLVSIASDGDLFWYMLKNFFYDFPVIGKPLFIKEARKIVPTLKYSELEFGKGIGGIRPQVINTKSRSLQMGEAKIIGEDIIFNITPSPGATICLKNGERDARMVVNFLGEGFRFDEDKFQGDFGSVSEVLETRENV